MNKQEALVALLEVCRSQEEPGREVARAPHEEVLALLVDAGRDLDVIAASPAGRRRNAKLRAHLAAIGGMALYLLVDEVDVVEPAEEVGYGKGSFVTPSPSSYAPVTINGGLVENTRYVPVIVPMERGLRA